MVYAVGGYNGSYLNTVEAYDPVTNAWSVQDPMPNVHYGATVGVLGDELHVVSGEGEGGAFTGAHDAFVASILNTPPTADAGPDQAARPGATINLNGAASFDDNTPSSQLGYAWSFVATPSGSAASLTGANTATPSFVADVPGNYAIELIVTDEGGLNSAADQVIVGTDLPPTANAGSDQLVVLGTTVTLNGSGSDPDGDSLTFSWTFASMPAGSGASLNGAQSQTPTFVPNVPGPYVVALTVSDALGAGSPDTVQITAVSPASYAQIQIQAAADALSRLPASSLTTEGNRQALMNFLSQAVQALQVGDLETAKKKLEAAISRTDGCAVRGNPDGNGGGRDWITTCDSQGSIYFSLIAALSVL
jgi:hypothetical protein